MLTPCQGLSSVVMTTNPALSADTHETQSLKLAKNISYVSLYNYIMKVWS